MEGARRAVVADIEGPAGPKAFGPPGLGRAGHIGPETSGGLAVQAYSGIWGPIGVQADPDSVRAVGIVACSGIWGPVAVRADLDIDFEA